jgi:hypothetical protein
MALHLPTVAVMEDFQGFILVVVVMVVTHRIMEVVVVMLVTHRIMEVMVVMLAHIVMAVHLQYLHTEALHLGMVA